MYNVFYVNASRLGDFQSMSKTELANGYCDADDANDSVKREQYYSALMLRYWFKVYDFDKKSEFARLELEDFVSWLSESLDIGLKYRRWRDPSNPLSKDPNAPDKVFNRCFFSTRRRWYAHFNKNKRKINYMADSIDRAVDTFDDAADIVIQNTEDIGVQDAGVSVVESFLRSGKIVQALIIDAIAHQDTFNYNVTKSDYRFSPSKVIKHLNTIDSGYINYFNSTYGVDKEELARIASKLSKSSKKELKSYIERTFKNIKNDPSIFKTLKESL